MSRQVALESLARQVGERLLQRGESLTIAESCTGGWLGMTLTAIAGSSRWFDRGFITYSNEAKQEMLGVSAQTLGAQGAVSEATVREMAAGALARSRADWSIAISGVAGPDGGSPDKPVGTVWLAWATPAGVIAARRHFAGNRESVREHAVEVALEDLLAQLNTCI